MNIDKNFACALIGLLFAVLCLLSLSSQIFWVFWVVGVVFTWAACRGRNKWILFRAKDGGPESPVDGFFLCEFKSLFSIVLLRFNEGQREALHSHAFNALTWFLCGSAEEEFLSRGTLIDVPKSGLNIIKNPVFKKKRYCFSVCPKLTPRHSLHRVIAEKTSWAISIRGPWSRCWTEYNPETKTTVVLGHGRIVSESRFGVGVYYEYRGQKSLL